MAVVFIASMFTCFSMVTDGMHSVEKNQLCDLVVSVVDNIILQTGITILLMVIAAAVVFGTHLGKLFTEMEQKMLMFYHGPPLNRNSRPGEYSYLSLLFSSGLLHSKIYNTAS